ncbi:response regulator [Alteromonas sp. BMJM2]|uniref:response regulator n=1 Tax=Alteromonas sp. BMJM2 TaxID=2954241 RepID=UPI0022B4BD82|nr:response regulator [Alteromonas sp. BMJM2]
MTEVIKILLIEDDEDDYFLTSDYLERCESTQFELTWVTDSDAALEALKERSFDLCLLDFLLGAENALDVLSILKANQFNVPVVILTGQSDAMVDEMVMRAGAADYLQKSEIESPRFMRTIRYALVRRDIENERIERNKVEQKNKAKDKFLAHLGHELRTPLTSILGYTELLIDDARNSPFQQELSIIHSNGKHLLSLLNDLLDMSRIMADKLELNVKRVNLASFLTDIHSLMQLNAKDKGLSLNVVAKTKMPEFIQTDPTRLRQILLNLITNAVKFTDSGTITLTIEVETSDTENQAEQAHSVLRFTVDDTGIGMAPDKLENIFHPFEQIEDVMRTNHGGAGLGLAICKELVCKLDGDISVTSRMGEGSSFSFYINPGDISAQSLEELTLGQLSVVEPANLNLQLTGKVLIVDDLREIRRLTGHLVSQSKADISYAENGVKALEAVLQADEQNAPFNLVLMDIHMPVMNGIEALHAIRRHGKNLPVIAVTAASRKGLKESLIREGFNDVIGKPIDRFALASLLSLYLPADNPVTFSNVEAQVSGMPTTKPFAPEAGLPRHHDSNVDIPDIMKAHSPSSPIQQTNEIKGSVVEADAPKTSKKKILVVEDDEDAAELLQLFLTHLGCDVVKSLCGNDALEAINEHRFDHVLMDLTLPDYDGYELAKMLKSQQSDCKLTIVSGHQADKNTMLSIGIDSSLLKPVTKDDLESVII